MLLVFFFLWSAFTGYLYYNLPIQLECIVCNTVYRMLSFMSVKAHMVIVTVVLGVNSPLHTLHTWFLEVELWQFFLLTLYRWTWIWSCLEVGWMWSLEPLQSALGALHPPPALTGKKKNNKWQDCCSFVHTICNTSQSGWALQCKSAWHASFMKCLLLNRLKSAMCLLFTSPLPAGPAPPLLAASPVRWTVCCTRSSFRRALLAWEWHSTSLASSTHR